MNSNELSAESLATKDKHEDEGRTYVLKDGQV